MTRQTFLRNLSKLKDKYYWYMKGNAIRAKYLEEDKDWEYNHFCPITAVYTNKTGEKVQLCFTDKASKSIGLPVNDMDAIMAAADGKSDKGSVRLREAMKRHLGLTAQNEHCMS